MDLSENFTIKTKDPVPFPRDNGKCELKEEEWIKLHAPIKMDVIMLDREVFHYEIE